MCKGPEAEGSWILPSVVLLEAVECGRKEPDSGYISSGSNPIPATHQLCESLQAASHHSASVFPDVKWVDDHDEDNDSGVYFTELLGGG